MELDMIGAVTGTGFQHDSTRRNGEVSDYF